MTKKLLFLFFLLTTLTSGIYSQDIEISFTDIELECSFKTDSGKLIVSNMTELLNFTKCDNTNINFMKYMLIGVEGGIGGCSTPIVEYKIIKDVSTKTYYVDAYIYATGCCRKNNHYRRVILIEKFEKNYKIIFEVEEIYR